MSGFKEKLAKPIIMRNAANAMAQWFADEKMTAKDLESRLMKGEDVLARALRGTDQKAITAARAMVGDVLRQLGDDDYKRILGLIWEMPAFRDHALLLGRSDIYQRYYVPAVERAKAWLTTGSPQ